MNYKNNFDLLRLIAAADVVLQHISHIGVILPSWVSVSVVSMATGVPIFFIVSGFLVTGSFLKSDGSLTRYFRNRALRIYPGLWVNLLFILSMLVAFGVVHTPTLFASGSVEFWGTMLATGSIILADRAYPFPLYWNDAVKFWPGGALWTIVVELGFYIAIPLLLPAAIRSRRWAAAISLGGVGIASYVFNSMLMPNSVWFYASPLPHLWILAIGALARLFWLEIRPAFEGKFPIWFAAYLVVHFVSGDQSGPAYFHPGALATMLMLLLAGCVLSFAYTWPGFINLRRHDISYGVYLHHMPILMLLVALDLRGLLGVAILVPATAIAAALSWKFVERPALALKRQLPKEQVPVSQLV
ncbi:acyltransferase [Bradyrhizobium sp. LA7.1]|uniref:acyltransferase family protein n=1 Tax=Bradyrhizobium sp. LA7.1 TaxID=3156324 RepID=UPI003396BA47